MLIDSFKNLSITQNTSFGTWVGCPLVLLVLVGILELLLGLAVGRGWQAPKLLVSPLEFWVIHIDGWTLRIVSFFSLIICQYLICSLLQLILEYLNLLRRRNLAFVPT